MEIGVVGWFRDVVWSSSWEGFHVRTSRGAGEGIDVGESWSGI